MLWLKTLVKLIKTCQTLDYQLFKTLLRNKLCLLYSRNQMTMVQFWLQTIFLRQKVQVFWSQQPQIRIRMGLIKQRNLLEELCDNELSEISDIKNIWKSKKIYKILHQFQKKISIKEWLVYWIVESFQRTLISLRLLRRELHLYNSRVCNFMRSKNSMQKMMSILKNSTETLSSLTYNQFRMCLIDCLLSMELNNLQGLQH